jgi:DNA helicase HerA-like ATPase
MPLETILGKKGRGKTFTAKRLVERLLELQRRVVVLDPLSVWWGLKASADGKTAGFPIPVFGAPHADIPLHDGAGRIIGELDRDIRVQRFVGNQAARALCRVA